jgi:transcriptional regulator GlxA family with amidase domain
VVKSLIWTFLVKLTRLMDGSSPGLGTYSESSNNFALIAPAVCHILSYYNQDISIEELAQLCFLSKRHFIRIFSKVMRQTPLNYITQTRIRMATALLKSTDLSILEVSMNVGYHSISSFNRNFLEIKKNTPKAYRNQYR